MAQLAGLSRRVDSEFLYGAYAGLVYVPMHNSLHRKSAYCKTSARSIKPEYLVSPGLCTHLGCVPGFRPAIAPADLGPAWRGGFHCPRHGSKFDLAAKCIGALQRQPT